MLLTLPFGLEYKTVSISKPVGAEFYSVLVNGFYRGRVHKVNGEWKSLDLHFMFDWVDIQLMGEMIDEGG